MAEQGYVDKDEFEREIRRLAELPDCDVKQDIEQKLAAQKKKEQRRNRKQEDRVMSTSGSTLELDIEEMKESNL